CFGGN
ncbi:aldehyde dehydrogenase family protein, partial [Vibrio parahaemolyticus V-223/04]